MKPFFTESDCDCDCEAKEIRHDGFFSSTKTIRGISLAKANALIAERSIRVLCHKLGDSGLVDEHRAGWTAHEPGTWPDEHRNTHQALLISVEAIEADSAEKVLAEMVEWWSEQSDDTSDPRKLIERARKLLRKG